MLTYADVIDGIKTGGKFYRKAWSLPGEMKFIFLVNGSVFTVNREPLLSILGEGTRVGYHAHIDMHYPDGSIATWTPSNEDQLADDWMQL